MQTQTPISGEMQTELNRINEPAGGVRWIPDPQEMLYVILARKRIPLVLSTASLGRRSHLELHNAFLRGSLENLAQVRGRLNP